MTAAARLARAEARMVRRRDALPHVGQPGYMAALRRFNRAVQAWRLRRNQAGVTR